MLLLLFQIRSLLEFLPGHCGPDADLLAEMYAQGVPSSAGSVHTMSTQCEPSLIIIGFRCDRLSLCKTSVPEGKLFWSATASDQLCGRSLPMQVFLGINDVERWPC